MDIEGPGGETLAEPALGALGQHVADLVGAGGVVEGADGEAELLGQVEGVGTRKLVDGDCRGRLPRQGGEDVVSLRAQLDAGP